MLYDDENKCMIVSRVGTVPELRALCIARTIPDGVRQVEPVFGSSTLKLRTRLECLALKRLSCIVESPEPNLKGRA
jgi:hypothetical protein